MKLLLMVIVILNTFIMAAETVSAKKVISRPTLPIEKPEHPIVRPPHRPIIRPAVVYQDNYYTTNVMENCQQYIEQIEALNHEINELNREIDRLQALEDARLQKTLKAKHQKELEKFDNRKNSVKTKNSINIKSK